MHEEARDEAGTNDNGGTRFADRHSLLIAQVPLGIFSLDSEGNILEANPALLSMLGIASVQAARDKSFQVQMGRRCIDDSHIEEFGALRHEPFESMGR